jgi:hypothetical protein
MGFERLYLSLVLAASSTLVAESASAQQVDPQTNEALPDLPANESSSQRVKESQDSETIYAPQPAQKANPSESTLPS